MSDQIFNQNSNLLANNNDNEIQRQEPNRTSTDLLFDISVLSLNTLIIIFDTFMNISQLT